MKNAAIKEYLQESAGVRKATDWLGKSYPLDEGMVRDFKDTIEKSDIIAIFGDYDCDGIVAAYELKKGISKLYPNKTVSVVLPDRFRDGYGLKDTHVDMLSRVLDQMEARGRGFKHPCIMTCDNGSSSMEVLQRAKEKIDGLSVIVTDHHLVPEGTDLSPADVFCNPHYGGFRYDGYCGAGVAYKLIEAIAQGYPDKDSLLRELEMYAGIATVADCMEVKEDNWVLVRKSLDTFKQDLVRHKTAEPFQKLFAAMEIKHPSQIDADFYGYKLGPLMNAMGRLLDHGASRMLKYLEDPTQDECDFILEINQKRRGLVDLTVDQLFEDMAEQAETAPVIVTVMEPSVYGEAAAEGLCGLFAGKLAEHFGKPAIVITPSRTDPDVYKGSARNVPGFNVHKFIQETMNEPEYLCGFGGHKEACGLSITREKLTELKEWIRTSLSGIDTAEYLYDDPQGTPRIFEGDLADMKDDYMEIQRDWAPFGNGYLAPLYAVEMDAATTEFHTMGEGKHFWAKPNDGVKVVHFHHDPDSLRNPEHFYLLGGLTENYYNGNVSLQFIARDIRDDDPLERDVTARRAITSNASYGGVAYEVQPEPETTEVDR